MTALRDLLEHETPDKTLVVRVLEGHTKALMPIDPDRVLAMIRRAGLGPSEMIAVHGYFGSAPHYIPCATAYHQVCEAVRNDMQEGYADF